MYFHMNMIIPVLTLNDKNVLDFLKIKKVDVCTSFLLVQQVICYNVSPLKGI
jgi:hypothetical protein